MTLNNSTSRSNALEVESHNLSYNVDLDFGNIKDDNLVLQSGRFVKMEVVIGIIPYFPLLDIVEIIEASILYLKIH